MADFLDKPDETSMDQQNSELSSSKKWRMMMGTLLKRYISKTIWTSPNCFGHDQSTLNIDLILWHTQLIVCAENVKSWFKSWVFPFTSQAYILPHTLDCMCFSLSKFHI